MAHPQNSPRGLLAKNALAVGGVTTTYNSTAILFDKGIRINGQANGLLTANSTGVNFPGAAFVSGQATLGKLTANSTALILPNSVRVGAKTTYLSSNSTGVKLGSLYISCNSTGNTTT